MARDAIDIKESLSALIIRPRAAQRCHEQRELCAKEAPGNRRVTEALASAKTEAGQ